MFLEYVASIYRLLRLLRNVSCHRQMLSEVWLGSCIYIAEDINTWMEALSISLKLKGETTKKYVKSDNFQASINEIENELLAEFRKRKYLFYLAF